MRLNSQTVSDLSLFQYFYLKMLFDVNLCKGREVKPGMFVPHVVIKPTPVVHSQ